MMISQLLSGSTFTETIFTFLQGAMASVTADLLLIVALSLIVAIIIVGTIRVAFSYESRAMRRIRKVNKYLVRNNTVSDENLVEFHRQMKRLPQRIRDRWQLFMLERDGSPSKYLTTEYCVKRPLYNSSTINVLKQVKTITTVLCLVTFVLGLASRLNEAGTVSMANIIYVLLYATIVPMLVGLLGFLFCMILQARFTALNTDFYDNFTIFVRNVDKATNTMPDYVDYELLFTKKEINEGIPILREYLEKKALEEQKLLEKSKREAIDHSPYSFDDLGVNGSQLIERAVHESETFLMNRLNLQNEIAEYEKQLGQAEKNMDDIEKEANKKLQAIKENLERLDKSISETTNRVEINYNRRQAKDEMDKKALIEKDLQSMLAKEQTAIDGYKVEIQRRKQDIENSKNGVEVALKSEYNTFATKVYDELSAKVSEENSNLVREYEGQIVQMKATIKQLSSDNEKKDTMLQVRNLELENMRNYGASGQNYAPMPEQQQPIYNEYNTDAYNASHETPNPDAQNLIQTTPEMQQDQISSGEPQEWNQYYDENGNLIDYSQYYNNNGENAEYSQYYDENGNLIDYSQYYDENGNYIGPDLNNQQVTQPAQEFEQNANNQVEQSSEIAQTQVEQPVADQQPIDQQYAEQPVEQTVADQQYAEQPVDEQQPIDQQYAEQPVDEQQPLDNTNANVEQPNFDSDVDVQAGQTNENIAEDEPTQSIDWSQFYDERGNFIENPNEDGGDEGRTPTVNVFGEVEEEPKLPQVDADGNFIEDANDEQDLNINTDNENNEQNEVNTSDDETVVEEFDVVNPEKSDDTVVEEFDINKPIEEEMPNESVNEQDNATTNSSDGLSLGEEIPSLPQVDENGNYIENDDAEQGDKSKLEKEVDEEPEEAEENVEKAKKKVAEVTEEVEKAEEKVKEAKEETEDLKKIQEQIAEENKKLMQQQQELRQQIDETLESIEKSNTKTERTKNVSKIKALIEKLKIQAKEAKASGASKQQLKQINSSVAELVSAIANYTTSSSSSAKNKKTTK